MKASRLETGIITTAPEPQPVGPLLEGALAQARPQAEAKGLTLAAEPRGGRPLRPEVDGGGPL